MLSYINTVIVLIPFVVFLLSIIYLFSTYFRRREYLLRAATITSIAVFLVVVLKIVVASAVYYFAWRQDEIGRYLLPPHQSLGYFLEYSWKEFIFSPAAGLAVSFILIIYFLLLNKFFKKQYLDLEDILILMTGSLMVGWPNIAVYLSLTFLLILARLLYLYFFKKEMRRIPMTLALIVSAFITLLAGDLLLDILRLGFLKV